MVESRWAINITVLSWTKLSIAFCTCFSDSESNDEVASSSINISGFFKIARAIERRCRWPPDNKIPASPIIVSYLFGS